MRLRQYFEIRGCLICHSFGLLSAQLCSSCTRSLEEIIKSTPLIAKGYSSPIFSLLEWNPKTERIVRPLIHALKGGTPMPTFEWLAERLVHKYVDFFSRQLDICYFVPEANRGRRHAAALAQAINKYGPGKLLSLSTDSADLRQKSKSKFDRGSVQFRPLKVEPRSAILVDDIATTGSTLKAMERAISPAQVVGRCVIATRVKDVL